ncbi:MAG: hypothetical protein WDA70_04940 [Lysobacteraceae bacterium]
MKQNLDSVKQTRVAQPRRALALATMFGLLAAGAGQLALAAEQTFASDLATASSKQRAIKDVDLDTGPWPLCSGETNTKALADGEQVLGLYPMGDGTYLVHTVDAIDSKTCVKSTTANLAFQFEGSTAKAVIADSTPPGSPIVYDFSGTPAELGATVTEPVICHGYYTAGDKLALVLTDTNNIAHVLHGVDTVGYQLSNGTVTPLFAQATYGPVARCHVFPYSDTTTNPPATPDPDTSDDLFSASFESIGDLEVTLLDAQGSPLQIGHITAAAGNEFTYKVRVSNLGEGPAEDVQVREFLPAAGGTVLPVIEARNCVRDDSLPCSGVLDVALGTINAGQSIEFTLTREIPTGTVGTRALAAVAAFSDPASSGDPVLGNNARSLVVEIVNQINITRAVSTNGNAGDTSGGSIIRTSAPAECSTESGGITTCPPGTMGLDYSAAANSGYTFTGFSGCAGTATGESTTGGTYTTSGGTSCTVTANFYSMPTVTAAAGANGSISPASQQIHHGEIAEFTITPDFGHQVALPITGCGGVTYDAGAAKWKTVNPVTDSCNVAAAFEPKQSVVTVMAGPNGTITSQNPFPVVYPDNEVVFIVKPDPTYEVQIASSSTCQNIVGPSPIPLSSSVMIGANGVYEDCQIDVIFSQITHQVTISSMNNGTLVLDNGGIVTHGDDAQFTVQPNTGYHLDGVVTGTPACGTVSDDGQTGTAGPITSSGCELSANFAINQYTVTVSIAEGSEQYGTIGEQGASTGDVVPVVIDPVVHGTSAEFWTFASAGYFAEVVPQPGCNFIFSGIDSLTGAVKFRASQVSASCNLEVEFLPD